jgi:hypothetical protein
MPTVKIKGGKTGSIKKMRASLKSGGGGNFITFIPEDGITVRFLAEPDQWVKFMEHYDEGYFPCVEGSCPGCANRNKPSKRYVAPALDIEEDKVIILKVPSTLATRLMAKFDRYETLMDRDYELTRMGSGLDTEYDAETMPPTKLRLSKYELPDLEQALVDAYANAFGDGNDADDDDDDDEEDEDERPARRTVAKKKAVRRTTSSGKSPGTNRGTRTVKKSAPAKRTIKRPRR